MKNMSNRTLALAGILQAGELVSQVAESGTWSGFAAEASLRSLFKLESDSPTDVFGDPAGIRLGLQTLAAVLSGETQQVKSLKYAIGLLQLEKSFSRMDEMQEEVGRTIARIESDLQGASDPDGEAPTTSGIEAAIAPLAELYSRTVSTIEPRIVVNGKPRVLQQEETVARIRAMLFAGLRAAVLWRQTGGSRWTLLFGRKKLVSHAQELLRA